MNHMNVTIIQGNLTKDPEFKDFGTSKVSKFTVASNRKFKDIEEVCFLEVECWGYLADNVNNYLKKGSPVLVEGRLKLDTWVTNGEGDPAGKKRSKHLVVANKVVFLARKKDSESEQQRY